jgi:parvulin-like peptidyl-prolyl isomerase
MAWNRRWLGVSLIGISGLLLSGCASDLPDWAQPKRSLAADISQPAMPLVRSQAPDGPAVTLQKPLLAPPGFGSTPAALPQPPANFGTQQVSMASRANVRVRVRAWVNGRPIFDDEVMQMAGPDLRRVFSLPDSQRAEKMSELMNNVLDQIVDQELMYQDAVKKLEKASPHSLSKMREYVDQEFDKSVDRMRKAKVPEEQIREMEATARRLMERNLISTEYARSRIKPVLESVVNMAQIREYYDEHKNEFMTVDKIVWQDIFIPTSKNLPTVEDAKRFGEELINKCRAPGDFDQLMVYNEGDSKLRGGEGIGTRLSYKDAMGNLVGGDIRPAEMDEHLSNLREGQIGAVVPFSTGVHLIRVTKREYAGQLPLDDQVQKAIRKKLENQLADREYRRIVRELRNRAVVRVERDGS